MVATLPTFVSRKCRINTNAGEVWLPICGPEMWTLSSPNLKHALTTQLFVKPKITLAAWKRGPVSTAAPLRADVDG
jgi:hypothetical protein